MASESSLIHIREEQRRGVSETNTALITICHNGVGMNASVHRERSASLQRQKHIDTYRCVRLTSYCKPSISHQIISVANKSRRELNFASPSFSCKAQPNQTSGNNIVFLFHFNEIQWQRIIRMKSMAERVMA